MLDRTRKNDLEYLLEIRKKFLAANDVLRICSENRQILPKKVRQKAHKEADQMIRDLAEFRGSSSVIRIVFETGQTKCWYTGEELDFSAIGVLNGYQEPNAATAEHINPLANNGKSDSENLVLAQRWINALLGNAPKIVKLNVKESLSRLKFHPECTSDNRREIQTIAVKSVMDSYKIEGDSHYPWEEKQGTSIARKKGLIAIVSRRRNRLALIDRLQEAAMI